MLKGLLTLYVLLGPGLGESLYQQLVYYSDVSAQLDHISMDLFAGQQCTSGNVRLVGGRGVLEGRVEVCKSGSWGRVCDYGWNSYDAGVLCRQLGYDYYGQ